jgi:hypothetical protein
VKLWIDDSDSNDLMTWDPCSLPVLGYFLGNRESCGRERCFARCSPSAPLLSALLARVRAAPRARAPGRCRPLLAVEGGPKLCALHRSCRLALRPIPWSSCVNCSFRPLYNRSNTLVYATGQCRSPNAGVLASICRQACIIGARG